MIILATMFANVSVPVIPDPNYLQQLYPPSTPATLQQQALQAPFGQQPLYQDGSTVQSATPAAQPTDIAGYISLAVTAGLGYFLQKQKTTTDRRTYMAADTTVKLAANDEASDAKLLKTVYAMSCMADIMGKYHREDMETYETIDGVSLWTYIENIRLSFNQDFKARYIDNGPVQTTGVQSKDKVVATFNKVQQSITPSVTTAVPNTLNVSGDARIGTNKASNASGSASSTTDSST